MEKANDAFNYDTFLDQLSHQAVWLDHYVPKQRRSGQGAYGAAYYGKAAEASLYVSCSCGGNGVCVGAVHDSVGIFQCGKNGLDTGGSGKRPGGILLAGFLDGDF